MNIQILIYEGFDELDAIGPFEVFANAGQMVDCKASLVTVDENDRIRASHGMTIEPDGSLDDPDLLVIPGGGWNARSEAGAWAEAERGTIPDAISRAHERDTTIASVCTGGMLLARAGILDGRPAITHGWAVEELEATDAQVVDARVVDDGSVLTAGGVTAGIDLALYIVDRELGTEIADTVASGMEYERHGSVYASDT